MLPFATEPYQQRLEVAHKRDRPYFSCHPYYQGGYRGFPDVDGDKLVSETCISRMRSSRDHEDGRQTLRGTLVDLPLNGMLDQLAAGS